MVTQRYQQLQQATDLYEITLRWNRSHTWFKPDTVRRLTESGEDGWVIPEFAWNPSGRRLLWTQNRYPATARVDQGCVVRKIRADIIRQLTGVHALGQIPFSIVNQIRDQGVSLLQDPRAFPHPGLGCGGDAPEQTPSFAQETKIAHY